MTPTAEWYEADADDSDRSITDDVTANTHETAPAATETGETGARVHGDADLLRKRTAALDRVAAENERLRVEVERMHSWQGLLELLDEHWPDDIFPTMADDATRDTGPRLVSALRRAEAAEAKLRDVAALVDEIGDGKSERTIEEWLVDARAIFAVRPATAADEGVR